ncbi:glycosyltransferase 87 family protein [Ruminococcaceae bacterium OttesenSCG-928-O06]|nr:glycosyltransferase 87 family protein [Ruminococcaceae bacterium OttesenSCG-928-O06]
MGKGAAVRRPRLAKGEGRRLLLFWVVAMAAALFFVHPDAAETASHAWLFLESVFSGQPRSFYGVVAAHQNAFAYLNNAHYNIIVYMVYAVPLLPVYLVCAFLGAAPPQLLLTFVGKGLCVAFLAACLPVLRRIAALLGLGEESAAAAPVVFAALLPVGFSAVVMGQYDVMAVFAMLVGWWCWLRGRMWPFVLWFGAAIALKSLPLLLFVPLLLLREKRIGHLALYGVCSLWLVVPTALLYRGVTFSKTVFDAAMMDRLFATRLMGGREVPLFAAAMVVLCVVAWFWRPGEKSLGGTSALVGLWVFGLAMILVEWHPQWVILLAPFLQLTTLAQPAGQRRGWLLVDVLLCMGFALVCWAAFPGQLEANLLGAGLLGMLGAPGGGAGQLLGWLAALSPLEKMPMALFCGAVAAHLLLKLPTKEGTLATRLFGQGAATALPMPLKTYTWWLFLLGWGVWLVPVLAHWLVG